jgi:integrase
MTKAFKLTKRIVDTAEARSARYTLFDGGEGAVKGFGLRVYPTGQKSWVFEYRSVDGGRRAGKKRITLGIVADFTPEQARKLADKHRSQVKIGNDPASEKAERRKAATVSELATSFLADHIAPKRKSGTLDHYADVLDRIVLPALGTTKAKDVTRADIARLHLKWKHTPFQANRMVAILASMFSYGSRRGFVEEDFNPARRIERFSESRRERFLTGDELERLGAAIREAETVGVPWIINPAKKTKHVQKENRFSVIGEHAAGALRLLIFTGARLREILDLKWEHVDFDRGLLLLPDSKTGRKAIVLNAPSLEVLANLPRIGAYVIAGDSAGKECEKPRSDLKRPWTVVATKAGLAGVRLHDMRHTFASFGAGGGMGLPVIGKLLGHAEASTTQRYAHLDNDPLRRASNTIAGRLASAMGEPVKSGLSGGEVIPLRKGRP